MQPTFSIEETSLFFTNAIVSLAMAGVLMVSRIGMGDDGRGIRTWSSVT